MYSGLLPKDITEDELSSDHEEHEQEDVDQLKDNDNKGSEENSTCSSADTRFVQGAKEQTHTDTDSPTCPMPGISKEMWQKFQQLKKKKDEIKAMKIPERRNRGGKRGRKRQETAETSERQDGSEKHWNELTQYFGVNDRFLPPPCSRPPLKSGLEKNIEKAIAEGDMAKAEEMSDRLATREMALKIAQAADCRDFVQHKQEEEALRSAQKRRRQIPWGFEVKKRWETKSNMGYM